ncbi:kinase, pfkB family protein [Toxoplasma gondii ME49]|uniref:adenosine kinase n=4 Tax=Toxoplasma gondii TaxID=5811 RepID=B6KHP6_TOXGV|nr:kinase, pfkB family protein [Toxoplasma gondii ME49]ESS34492.1 kinase, pfkB family protein [Toxoplasma gondii VEG]KYF50240.1 kinase, pfkB family protein [Toxoplasma gondii ARI]PIM04345.1 kinase, pfkB family protein [Toxoplasma gondii COUG]EPT25194.1 kinase, pfkB family protein [Toxoplasma gondii ME49]CEL78648.1 TPA: adenosine kinase [Toxoplasma gondii VEG]|eukprot:XP_002367369.1 kinase, pfkB family protein [Toxoplasma gondii ME49]
MQRRGGGNIPCASRTAFFLQSRQPMRHFPTVEDQEQVSRFWRAEDGTSEFPLFFRRHSQLVSQTMAPAEPHLQRSRIKALQGFILVLSLAFLSPASASVTDRMAVDSSNSATGPMRVFAIGNPILDLVAEVPSSFLDEFFLKRGDATLATPEQMRIYSTLDQFNPTSLPGGSALNSVRVVQKLLRKPGSAGYMGAIGDDPRGQVLKELCDKEGLATRFMVAPGQSTGVCAVLINEKERTLCTHLGACGSFRLPEDWTTFASGALIFYATAYTLTATPKNALEVAGYAHGIPNAIFTLNLSAPFCVELYKDAMQSLLLHTNILFGNEEEFAHLAKVHNLVAAEKTALSTANKEHAVEVCTGALRLLTAGQNTGATKLVVMTRGHNPVIAAEQTADGTVVVHEVGVPVVAAEKIVDTNGAGDAFVGGFLYALSQGKTVKQCIMCGNACAQDVIQHVGFSLSFTSLPC